MGNILDCTQIDTRLPCNCFRDDLRQRKLKQIQDTRFGLIEVTERKENSQRIYVKERVLNLNFDTLEEYKFRSQLSSSNLLTIHKWSLIDDKIGKIRIHFEAYDGDFQQEISQAILSNCRFDEASLTIVLRSIVNALCYLQDQNISHQNITPKQILMVGNTYKLHDNYVIAHSQTLLDQAKRNENLRYLAPELHDYYFEKTQTVPDLFKADIYSLGMLILDAGTLNDSDSKMIDGFQKKISKQNLQARLLQFQSMFPNLSSIVNEMLEFDPNKRPNPLSLHEKLTYPTKREKRRRITLSPRQVLQLKRSNSPAFKEIPSFEPHHHDVSATDTNTKSGFTYSQTRKCSMTQGSSDEAHFPITAGSPLESYRYISTLGSVRSESISSNHNRSISDHHTIENVLVPLSSLEQRSFRSNVITQPPKTHNLGGLTISENLSVKFLTAFSGDDERGVQPHSNIKRKNKTVDVAIPTSPNLDITSGKNIKSIPKYVQRNSLLKTKKPEPHGSFNKVVDMIVTK